MTEHGPASCLLCRKVVNDIDSHYNFLTSFPSNRLHCINETRPCPWVRCKHHMVWYNNLTSKTITFNTCKKIKLIDTLNAIVVHKIFLMPYSCSLDLLEQGNHTLEEIADATSMTRERVRQMIETKSGKLQGVIPRKLRKRVQPLKHMVDTPIRAKGGDDYIFYR